MLGTQCEHAHRDLRGQPGGGSSFSPTTLMSVVEADKGQKGSPRKDPEPRPGGPGQARLKQFAVVLLGFFITRGPGPCRE